MPLPPAPSWWARHRLAAGWAGLRWSWRTARKTTWRRSSPAHPAAVSWRCGTSSWTGCAHTEETETMAGKTRPSAAAGAGAPDNPGAPLDGVLTEEQAREQLAELTRETAGAKGP